MDYLPLAQNTETNELMFKGAEQQLDIGSLRTRSSRSLWVKPVLTLALVITTAASIVLFLEKPFGQVADIHHTANFADASPEETGLDLANRSVVAWAAGKFSGANARQEARTFFTEDCVVDATVPMSNTDIMKIYNGIDGVLDWVNQLKHFQFKDFVSNFFFASSGTVMMQDSYTPIVASTGLAGPKMSDTLVYTITGGKISSLKFYWGNAAGIDALFDAGAPPAVVKAMYAAWFAGQYVGIHAHQELAKAFAEEVVFDASADMKNTDIFKFYNGLGGAVEWCKNLDKITFTHFVPVCIQGPPGVVFCSATYTATIKATGKSTAQHDMQAWTVQNGKIIKVKFFWGNPKGWDASYGK